MLEADLDLFECLGALPVSVFVQARKYLDILEEGSRDAYEVCREFLAVMEAGGYTFDYGLDGQPYDLKKVN